MMTTTSFAERARRFLAERSTASPVECEESEVSEERGNCLRTAEEPERQEAALGGSLVDFEPPGFDPAASAHQLSRPLGYSHAALIAARYDRATIVATLKRLRIRAGESDASALFKQVASDWAEILAVKDSRWKASREEESR